MQGPGTQPVDAEACLHFLRPGGSVPLEEGCCDMWKSYIDAVKTYIRSFQRRMAELLLPEIVYKFS